MLVHTLCRLYKMHKDTLQLLIMCKYITVKKVTLLSSNTYYKIYSKHFVIIARTTSLYTNLSTAILNSSVYLQVHIHTLESNFTG
jgi:hypothetical protein